VATKKNIALTKQEIFIKLASDAKPYVRTALAQNPEINKEIQSILLKDESGGVLRALAMNPSVSNELIDGLVKIIKSDAELSSFIIQGFFSNTKLPKTVVKLITGPDYSSSDFMAIKSKALSASEKQVCLKRMIKKDAYSTVLRDAAACDALDQKQIEFLLAHEAEDVRAELARNPIISEAIQLKLSKDKSTTVKQRLASNPALSAKLEELLSKDKEEDVTYSLARNLRSRSPKVANKNAKVDYAKVLKSGDDKELITLALDVNTPPDVIEQLCAKYDPTYDNWVSAALAQNPRISADRVNSISKSKNSEVLKALATNSLVTLDILTALLKNKDHQVRGVVANPSFYEIPPFMIS
jgi:hypothetical protein